MNIFSQWWAHHGTKIIGFGTTIVGVISAVDQATIHAIETVLGPMYAHAILIIAGLTTAYRGFVNSQNAKTPQPPVPPA